MPVWRALARTTPKVSPGSIENASSDPRINNLRLDYSEGTRTMTFYGEVRSKRRAAGYSIIISFKKVKREDGLTEEEVLNGFYPKPTLKSHEVLLRCSCPSYRFRFDKANRLNGVGTGARFGAYQRKTNRKPNNPRDLPGFCKHGLEFVDYLLNNGFVL